MRFSPMLVLVVTLMLGMAPGHAKAGCSGGPSGVYGVNVSGTSVAGPSKFLMGVLTFKNSCAVTGNVVGWPRVSAIRHIFISPGHNFFGRYGEPAGAHATRDLAVVNCRAGWGLEGDRFYG